MLRQWRLIYDMPALGANNMAKDEALLQSVGDQLSPPTLRLYGWDPLCLSLGYGQRIRDVDLERVAAHGWGLVRRPTGGKAILHGNELTYSVALPRDHEVALGDVVESYRRISQALLTALNLLGLHPESEAAAKGTRELGPVCFEVPSQYEIVVNGKKLMGSAQVRRRQGILQHGSLPLFGDMGLICEALAYTDEVERDAAKQNVRARATTLQAETGRQISWDEAAAALAQGFSQIFQIDWCVDVFTEDEKNFADELQEQQFANPTWTNKR